MTGLEILKNATRVGSAMHEDQCSLRDLIASNDKIAFESDQVGDEGIQRLLYNHRWSKAALHRFVGGSKKTLEDKLAAAVKAGVIADPIQMKGNKNYSFYEGEVQDLLDYWGKHPRYSIKNKKLDKMVVTVANQKGGVGKTSTTLTLATATALDFKLRARVLVIDLDPQGSAFQFVSNANTVEKQLYLTMADILLGKDYEEGPYRDYLTQNSDADIISRAPLKTHLSNLDILPAHGSDARLSDFITSASNEDKIKIFERLKKEVLPVLFESYDIIMIDTPPADSPQTWLALDVANYLLTPICPKEMDYTATAAFFKGLESRVGSLPSRGENLRIHRTVLTNHDPKSLVEVDTKYRISKTNQEILLGSEFIKSDAFVAAAKHCRTVLDVKAADGFCSNNSLNAAVNSVNNVYTQYIMSLLTVA